MAEIEKAPVEKDTGIHGAMSEAWEKFGGEEPALPPEPAEAPQEPTEPVTPIKGPPEKGTRPRDETGKFIPAKEVAKEPAKTVKETPAVVAKEPATAPAKEPEASKHKAPDNWPQDAKALFTKQPAEVQEQWLKQSRGFEADYTRKLQAIQPYQKVVQAARQWENYLAQIGRDPATAFSNLMTAEARLRMGTPQEKAAQLRAIAQQYGIQLEEAAKGQPEPEYKDPALSAMEQRLNQVTQLLQSQAQGAQQNAYNGLLTQIDAFAKQADAGGNPAHPHFEAVADEMAHRVQIERAAGRQPDLQSLYDKAVWANPDTRAQMLSADEAARRAKHETEAKKRAEDAEANAKAAKQVASVRGAPNGAVAPAPPANIREALEMAGNRFTWSK